MQKLQIFFITSAVSFFDLVFKWNSLKSGPKTRDLGLWEPGPLGPGTRHPDTQDPRTGTLEHGTLTPRTLAIGPWELEIATLRPIILSAGPRTCDADSKYPDPHHRLN